jgi:hypothetical protein
MARLNIERMSIRLPRAAEVAELLGVPTSWVYRPPDVSEGAEESHAASVACVVVRPISASGGDALKTTCGCRRRR